MTGEDEEDSMSRAEDVFKDALKLGDGRALRALDKLLGSIGLACRWSGVDVEVVDEHGCAVSMHCLDEDGGGIVKGSASRPAMLLAFLAVVDEFTGMKTVKNPFYGSTSIEEMLVKMDLMGR